MALQPLYYAGQGPLQYEDTNTYSDLAPMEASRAPQHYVEDEPTLYYHVVRLSGLTSKLDSVASAAVSSVSGGAASLAMSVASHALTDAGTADSKAVSAVSYAGSADTSVVSLLSVADSVLTSSASVADSKAVSITGQYTNRRLSMRPTILPSKVVKVGSDYFIVPTMVDYGATTGYSLPLYSAGNDEELYFSEYIAGRWDGASDITCSVIGYLGAAEDENDDFKLQLSWNNKATASGIVPATTTDVTVDTNITDARKAQYSIYKVEFTIDWNLNDPDIVASDFFAGRIRRIATGGTEMTGEFVVVAIIITYTVDKIFKAP